VDGGKNSSYASHFPGSLTNVSLKEMNAK
jgi:hypothetical protein